MWSDETPDDRDGQVRSAREDGERGLFCRGDPS
jgi:hypothetical protein